MWYLAFFLIQTHFTSFLIFHIWCVPELVNQVSVYISTEPFLTFHQHLISHPGIGMNGYDCGLLVCVMAADSFLMCICFRPGQISPQSKEKSLQKQWLMREQHKINGLNIPRLCDRTVPLSKAKILLCHVIILLVPTHSQSTATDFNFG